MYNLLFCLIEKLISRAHNNNHFLCDRDVFVCFIFEHISTHTRTRNRTNPEENFRIKNISSEYKLKLEIFMKTENKKANKHNGERRSEW